MEEITKTQKELKPNYCSKFFYYCINHSAEYGPWLEVFFLRNIVFMHFIGQ